MARVRGASAILVSDPYAVEFQQQQPIHTTTHTTTRTGYTGAPHESRVPSPWATQVDTCEEEEEDDELSVVLDCANIGWAYGRTRFSAAGVEAALAFFRALKIRTVAFLPAAYARRRPDDGSRSNALMETDELAALDALVGSGQLALVPPDGHDDLYVLSYAWSRGAYMVSNDFYTEHVQAVPDPRQRDATRRWVRFYRVSFAFAGSELLLNPRSPLFEELRNRRITVPMELVPESEEAEAIGLLTRAVDSLRSQGTGTGTEEALRHSLLARACLWEERGLAELARADRDAAR